MWHHMQNDHSIMEDCVDLGHCRVKIGYNSIMRPAVVPVCHEYRHWVLSRETSTRTPRQARKAVQAELIDHLIAFSRVTSLFAGDNRCKKAVTQVVRCMWWLGRYHWLDMTTAAPGCSIPAPGSPGTSVLRHVDNLVTRDHFSLELGIAPSSGMNNKRWTHTVWVHLLLSRDASNRTQRFASNEKVNHYLDQSGIRTSKQ